MIGKCGQDDEERGRWSEERRRDFHLAQDGSALPAGHQLNTGLFSEEGAPRSTEVAYFGHSLLCGVLRVSEAVSSNSGSSTYEL